MNGAEIYLIPQCSDLWGYKSWGCAE